MSSFGRQVPYATLHERELTARAGLDHVDSGAHQPLVFYYSVLDTPGKNKTCVENKFTFRAFTIKADKIFLPLSARNILLAASERITWKIPVPMVRMDSRQLTWDCPWTHEGPETVCGHTRDPGRSVDTRGT